MRFHFIIYVHKNTIPEVYQRSHTYFAGNFNVFRPYMAFNVHVFFYFAKTNIISQCKQKSQFAKHREEYWSSPP